MSPNTSSLSELEFLVDVVGEGGDSDSDIPEIKNLNSGASP
jgi:hypothetical protein